MRTCLPALLRYFILVNVLTPAVGLVSPTDAKPVIPPPPVPSSVTAADPGRADLLGQLRRAKAADDVSALRDLEERLGTVIAAPVRMPTPAIHVFGSNENGGGEEALRWSGDVCITCPWAVTGDPALSCRSNGSLYAAALSADAHSIYIYRSTDGGENWQAILYTSTEYALGDPCLAVGEGNLNRLLCAYVFGSGTSLASVQVLTLDLDTSLANITTALSLPGYAFAHPRICVDSPEWAYWYPYVVCLTQGLDTAAVRFTRSLDYGDQWTAAVILDTGLTLTDRADIDFGGATLTAAYSVRSADSDVKLRISRDFGQDFEPTFPVTSTGYEEYEPRVATTTSGAMTLVVFARQYGPGNRDIDCVYSTDAGLSWSGSYLPYSAQDERRPAVVASPASGRLYAAYWGGGEIRFTWADTPQSYSWAAPRTVNEETAGDVAWPALTLRPINCGCFPDMNCDGVINANDIGPFNLAMTDPIAYHQAYPNCDINQADTDCDGDIDASDLERLMCLIDGSPDCCPDSGGDAAIAWPGDETSAPGVWFDYASSRLPEGLPDLSAAPAPAVNAAGMVQVRPNPTTARAMIDFVLPAAGLCRLSIYSAAGRRVAVLHDGLCGPGSHTFTWDGRDEHGRVCAPAVYFFGLVVNGQVEMRRVTLVN